MTAFDRRGDGSRPLDVDDEVMWSQARRPLPSSEALHRIAVGVKARMQPAVGPRARFHVWVAASALLLVGGVAGAGIATFVMKRPSPTGTDPIGNGPMAARARGPRAASPEPAKPLAPPTTVAADEGPAPAEAPISVRRSGAGLQQRVAAVVPPSPLVGAAASPASLEPPASGPAAEAAMLRSALAALNRDRDPAAALASLDRYDARFPTGMLRGEATLARARSLRELGHDQDLLALLEHTSFDGVARGGELRVLRGELRMTRGRFADARDDFQAALAAGGPGAVQERALFGLASCRTRLGDQAGARADLRRFLEQFPASARAAEVRDALAR